MKFDVVLANPPFNMTGWEKHSDRHLHLLKDESYYALVCPATTSNKCIRDRCKRFETIGSKLLGRDDDIIYRGVHYYVWKKHSE